MKQQTIPFEPTTPPLVWLIGGSDSGGSAGLQADLRAVSALNGHGCSIITAITAQNSLQLQATFASTPQQLLSQLNTLIDDLPPAAIKIGQLPDSNIAFALADWLSDYRQNQTMSAQHHPLKHHPLEHQPRENHQQDGHALEPASKPHPWVATPVIWDPVIYASSGALLSALCRDSIKKILQVVDIITPNLPELALLSGNDITAATVDDALALVQIERLQRNFHGDILLKGGHSAEQTASTDAWFSQGQASLLSLPRLITTHTRGTGCTLASAFATALALGYQKEDALCLARAYLQQALHRGYATGKGAGSLGIGTWPAEQADFPSWQTLNAPFPSDLKFSRLIQPLGLYPVVDDVKWLIRLLPLGVQTIQLRLKNHPVAELERQIQQAVALCRDYQIQLFINDHWQLAIKYRAFGVHLGQEDLAEADLAAIAASGLRLGVSTHGYAELARVLKLQPSYIALGHIFPTQTKQMPSTPQGLTRLRDYVRLCEPLPTVAIGGINQQNIQQVLQTGVKGVAVVSAVVAATQPEIAFSQLQQSVQSLSNARMS
jgi:hydroxymethylpyrimidine kinase/phosphomethylpyrimidine kinase/thiamine-phosphate diphosphorylase